MMLGRSVRPMRRFVLPLLGCLALAGFAVSPRPAVARPLLLSDLPPELRNLPNAREGMTGSADGQGRVVEHGIASWYGAP
jgi:hypothetical protein